MKTKTNGFRSKGSSKLQLWLITLLLGFIISSCDDTDEPPDPLTVTTDTPTAITETQAKLGGVVTNDGGHEVTERGVCVSLEENPTINDPLEDDVLSMGTGKGAFSDTFEGFPPGTTVHVRAFATNSTGTMYGEDKVFTTLAPTTTVPSVTTNAVTGITDTQATLGGLVTSDGGNTVTARGVCISLEINPTINDPLNDDVLAMGSGTGAFSDTFEGFPPGTTVHVRAFATNSNGTAYGEDKVFTTLPGFNGCPVVTVSASITTPTTWTEGNVYMITGIISVSAALTIEPGTVVKLNGGSIDIITTGKIIANGTAENRIVFTSAADDSFCGDSNGDGTATTAQKGDWQMLYLNGGTGNTFNYCDFLYGGKARGGRNSVVEISVAGPSFTFDHCTFAHTLSSSSSTAYAIFAQSYMNDPTVSKFTNNAFYDNDRPIFLDVNYTLNPNNIFHDPANPGITNTRNGVFLSGGSISGHTVSWNVTEVPYVLDGSCRAFSGSVLNIGPNVIVKFNSSSSELFSTNTVNLHATAFLTSYKDDAHGGDTNGDGNASSPAVGDWYGFGNNPTGFTVWMSGPNILYASH
jgi:hypothetical protein